jgi:hypothetical protein
MFTTNPLTHCTQLCDRQCSATSCCIMAVHGMHKLWTDAWKFRQIFKRLATYVGSHPNPQPINKGAPPQKGVGRTHLLCSASIPPQHATVRGAAFPRLRAAGKEENRVIFKPKGRPCPHGPCECQRGLHTDNLHSVNNERLSRAIHPFFTASVSLLPCCALAQTSTLQRWPTL